MLADMPETKDCHCKLDGETGYNYWRRKGWCQLDDPKGTCLGGNPKRCTRYDPVACRCSGFYWDYTQQSGGIWWAPSDLVSWLPFWDELPSQDEYRSPEENPCLEAGLYACAECESEREDGTRIAGRIGADFEGGISLEPIKFGDGICSGGSGLGPGHCYSAEALTRWTKTNPTDPLTRGPVFPEEIRAVMGKECQLVTLNQGFNPLVPHPNEAGLRYAREIDHRLYAGTNMNPELRRRLFVMNSDKPLREVW